MMTRGSGATDIGFGQRPAILVIDFQRGFTDPRQTLGGSALVESAVRESARLLDAARAVSVPVIQTRVVHEGAGNRLRWKIPAVLEEFDEGAAATEFEPRTFDPTYDIVIRKNAPSIFFNTHAVSVLVKGEIDTTVIVGCNTSGCVRASIVDAFSYGFRVVVPRECVGDVEDGPHEGTLRDVGRRYADVRRTDDVLAALRDCADRTTFPQRGERT